MLTRFIVSLAKQYFAFHTNISESDKQSILQFIYFVANTEGLARTTVDEWLSRNDV